MIYVTLPVLMCGHFEQTCPPLKFVFQEKVVTYLSDFFF